MLRLSDLIAGMLRMVANGCRRLRTLKHTKTTLSERDSNLQTSRVKREPFVSHSGKKRKLRGVMNGPKLLSTCKRQDDLTVNFHDAGLLSCQSRHQPNPQSVRHMCSWLRSTSKRSHCKATLSRRWCCLKKAGWPKCFEKENHLGTQNPVTHTPYTRQSFCFYTGPCEQLSAGKITMLLATLATHHTYTLISDFSFLLQLNAPGFAK